MITKTFDSVELMHELRAKLSQEMEHFTTKERLQYIRERAARVLIGQEKNGESNEAV